jgi:hypothetical protein
MVFGRKKNRKYGRAIEQLFRFAYPKNNESIVTTYKGNKSYIHMNFLIFCIYQYTDEDLYFLRHIENYSKLLNVVVVLNNDVSHNNLDIIKKYSSDVIVRENIGYDFLAYKTGYKYITRTYPNVQNIIFANDSTFGPFFPIDKYVNEVTNSVQTVPTLYGMISSHEHGYHVQSFWFAANSALVHSKYFRDFWLNVRALKYKENIIDNYEIGLSKFCIKKGSRIKCFFDFPEVWNVHRKLKIRRRASNKFGYSPTNPSFHFWKTLIEECDYPFLKKEVVYASNSGFWDNEISQKIKDAGYTEDDFLKFLRNREIMLVRNSSR